MTAYRDGKQVCDLCFKESPRFYGGICEDHHNERLENEWRKLPVRTYRGGYVWSMRRSELYPSLDFALAIGTVEELLLTNSDAGKWDVSVRDKITDLDAESFVSIHRDEMLSKSAGTAAILRAFDNLQKTIEEWVMPFHKIDGDLYAIKQPPTQETP